MGKKYHHDFNDIKELGRFDLPWGNQLVFVKYNHVLDGVHKHSTGMMGVKSYISGHHKPKVKIWVRYTEFDQRGNVMAGCNEINPDLFKNGIKEKTMAELTQKHIEKFTNPQNVCDYNKKLKEYLLKDPLPIQ